MMNDKQVYRSNFAASLRTALNLGYASRVNPYSSTTTTAERSSVKPALLKQWIVREGDVAATVAAALETIPRGEVRQLMAGTGTGKTTKVPLALAAAIRQSVIVVVPQQSLAIHVEAYVSRMAADQRMAATVQVLTRGTINNPSPGPVVYYVGMSEFLAFFASTSNLFTLLQVGFVIVDESHFVHPGYLILKRLVNCDDFSGVRMMYSSATAASDVSAEQSDNKRVQSVPYKHDVHPNIIDRKSPLDAKNVNCMMMVFVANDAEVDEWVEYYREHDVPSFGLGYRDGTTSVESLRKFCEANKIGVAVVVSVVETGYTFPLDAVFDTGYKSDMIVDLETAEVRVRRRPVTQIERVQRLGRGGRVRYSTCWYLDVQCSQPEDEDDPNVCVYVYLWSRIFGLNIRTPSISRFSGTYGQMTLPVIALLLCSPFPPAAMLPYVHDEGFFCGWSKPFEKLVQGNAGAVECDERNENIVSWPEQVYHDGVSGAKSYLSRFYVDPLLAPLSYHVWKVYSGDADAYSVAGVTNYGTVRGAPSNRGGVRQSALSFVQTPAAYTRRISRFPKRMGTLYTVDDDVEEPSGSSDAGSRVTEYLERLPLVDNSAPARKVLSPPSVGRSETTLRASARDAVSRAEQPVSDPVASWVESSSSSSGKIIPACDVRRCNPVKYWDVKLFPFDDELRQDYVYDTVPKDKDKSRYRALLSGSVLFSKLARHMQTNEVKQREYFLSVIRVHNGALVNRLQALVKERRTLFGGSRADSYTEIAQQSARMLVACQEAGFDVARKSRADHSSMGSISVSLHDGKRGRAEFALQVGPEVVITRINALLDYSVPLRAGNNRLAIGWCFNSYQFTVNHAFAQLSEQQSAAWLIDTDGIEINPDHDVARARAIPTESAYVRSPQHSEHAYLVAPSFKGHRIDVFGFSRVYTADGKCYLDEVLSQGYSGALVVAASDGAVLGMYVGAYITLDGVSFCSFVPADVIFS